VQAWFLEKLPVPPLTRDQVDLLGTHNVVAPGALTLRDLGIEPMAMEAVVSSYLDRYRPQVKRRPRSD
jgi:NADH dehydrogenase